MQTITGRSQKLNRPCEHREQLLLYEWRGGHPKHVPYAELGITSRKLHILISRVRTTEWRETGF